MEKNEEIRNVNDFLMRRSTVIDFNEISEIYAQYTIILDNNLDTLSEMIIRALFSRWLLSKGKNDEVKKIYRKMARINNLPVTEQAISMFEKLNAAQVETVYGYTFISYFSSQTHILLNIRKLISFVFFFPIIVIENHHNVIVFLSYFITLRRNNDLSIIGN